MFQFQVVSFHVKESNGFDTFPPFNQAYEMMLLLPICINQKNPFLSYENNCLISSRVFISILDIDSHFANGLVAHEMYARSL